MTHWPAAGPAKQANTRIAARLAPALTSVVLFVLFSHAGPTELAILAATSALCYFEVIFALRLATTDDHANVLCRAARRSALNLARHKPPELSRSIFRNARCLRRVFPARPFVGHSRKAHRLDAEAAPAFGFAFA